MTISTFFHSWPGMYLAQTFLHSLIAAIIVDTSLIAWKIENPATRQRFRLLVVIIPIVAFPFYQTISEERGLSIFRLDAFFDFNRWMTVELWGTVPLGILFLLLLTFSAVIFLIQELAPILRHPEPGADDELIVSDPGPGSPVDRALQNITESSPPVRIIDDPDLVIFSTTGKDPAIYLSEGLIQTLTAAEMQAAIAHEIGHIRRSRRPLMVVIFLLRMIMFYNPVILMEFRRIVQEEEKICDDLAIAMTGDRSALAGALRKFFEAEQGILSSPSGTGLGLHDRLQEYSHTVLIESRLARLESPASPEIKGRIVLAIVFVTILVINFYVV